MRLVQIGRRATTVTASPEQLEDARAHYARDHWLSLEGFVEPDLLAHARALIEESPFQFLDSFGTELRMDSGRAFDLLEFVTNDQALYSFVERVTGCEAIGCFHGRIYRMGAEHVADWHDDVVATRMVAMTINLSAAPFAGGELQLMDTTTGHIVDVPSPAIGDALLFRIAPGLRHRNTAIRGSAAKTAFAGWFRREPRFKDLLFARVRDGATGSGSNP